MSDNFQESGEVFQEASDAFDAISQSIINDPEIIDPTMSVSQHLAASAIHARLAYIKLHVEAVNNE